MRSTPNDEVTSDVRVLVIGPRGGLLRELRRRKVAHAVWSDRKRPFKSAEAVHVAPFDLGEGGARREANALLDLGPFTHVIAGTESAVVTASRARRVLGARASSTSVIIRCHDKLKMKIHLQSRGIPMTPFVDPRKVPVPEEIVKRLGARIVVKPRSSSGSRDIRIIEDAHRLADSESKELTRSGLLIERMVDAPEASVESFVQDGEVLFENITEYAKKAHVNVLPASLPDETKKALLELNRAVLLAMRIQWGMTHLEAFLTDEGPLFGEIALRPPGGYIMDLLKEAWGFDPWRAFVEIELGNPCEFPKTHRAHAAALVLHPGEGTLTAIHGEDAVRRHPAVVRSKIKMKPGDRIDKRTGVGMDIGHVILRARTREGLLAAWTDIEGALRFEIAES